jgi:hypothetical protein
MSVHTQSSTAATIDPDLTQIWTSLNDTQRDAVLSPIHADGTLHTKLGRQQGTTMRALERRGIVSKVQRPGLVYGWGLTDLGRRLRDIAQPPHHDVLREVLGLSRGELAAFSSWQLAELALEIVSAIDIDSEASTSDSDRLGLRYHKRSLEVSIKNFRSRLA